jgi:hypothetical protein
VEASEEVFLTTWSLEQQGAWRVAHTMEGYTYDPVGNRLSSLGVSSYTNNSSNELTTTSNASYTYDYNGRELL